MPPNDHAQQPPQETMGVISLLNTPMMLGCALYISMNNMSDVTQSIHGQFLQTKVYQYNMGYLENTVYL